MFVLNDAMQKTRDFAGFDIKMYEILNIHNTSSRLIPTVEGLVKK